MKCGKSLSCNDEESFKKSWIFQNLICSSLYTDTFIMKIHSVVFTKVANRQTNAEHYIMSLVDVIKQLTD